MCLEALPSAGSPRESRIQPGQHRGFQQEVSNGADETSYPGSHLHPNPILDFCATLKTPSVTISPNHNLGKIWFLPGCAGKNGCS